MINRTLNGSDNEFNINSDSESEVGSHYATPVGGHSPVLNGNINQALSTVTPRVQAISSMNEPAPSNQLDDIIEFQLPEGFGGILRISGTNDDAPLIAANMVQLDSGELVDPATIPGFKKEYKDPKKDVVDHAPNYQFHDLMKSNNGDPKGKGLLNPVRSYELSALRNTNLVDKPHLYRNANYVGKNLHHIDFRGLNLNGLDFTGADFRNAYINHADFRGAKLEDTNFDGHFPEGTNFTGTNMKGASLSFWYGAKDVKFVNTDLRNSNLQCSIFYKCTFDNVRMLGAHVENITAMMVSSVTSHPKFFDSKVKSALKRG